MTPDPDDTVILEPDEVRQLIATGIRLGHDSARMGIPVDQAIADAVNGSEFTRLHTALHTATLIRRRWPATRRSNP